MKVGIRGKIIAIVLVLIILPIAALGVISYFKASDILLEFFEASNSELNKSISESIVEEFKGYKSGLKMTAENDNIKGLAGKEEMDIWTENLLKGYYENFENIGHIYMGDIYGNMYIYPHIELGDDFDPRDRPWYKDAISSGEFIWTDVYVDVGSGKASVSGAMPVHDSDGQISGVIAIDIKLEGIAEELNKIKVGENGYVFVLAEDGTIVTHPDPSQIGKELPVQEIRDAIQSSKSGFVKYGYNGDVKEANYEFIEEQRWFVMTSMFINEIDDETGEFLRSSVIVGILVILIGSVVGVVFAGSLTRPITEIVNTMKVVAAGDLTTKSEVKTKDEIGDLSDNFNTMIENVRELVGNAYGVSNELSESAENLAASSEEASASSDEVTRTVEEIAKGATDQAEETENSVKLTSGLSDNIEKLFDSSKNISENTNMVIDINKRGVEVVKDLKDKSQENMKSTEEISDSIDNLEKQSRNIGGILETISSISEQTNLLALNASIEAARAGEHGKGFAVVAEEIRKLAEESSSSADEIRKIIEIIQGQTNETVEIMGIFKENSQVQFKAVEEVNDSYVEITNSINEIVGQIAEINNFIEVMMGDKEKIVGSITNISSVSEQTAAASEQVSATMDQQNMAVETVAQSAEQLSKLAMDLQTEIRKFKI